MKTIQPSSRVLSVEYAIRDVLAAAKALEKKGRKIYYLNIGDPNKFDFVPPAHVLKAFADAVMDPKYSCYAPSEGDPELREAIARREGVTAEDVMITAGMSEGISFLFASLLNPGDNVLQPSPSYPLYMTMSRFYDGKDNYYKCDGNWLPDVDDIRKKINPRTRAIVVINPNNPTGAVYEKKRIKEIVDLAGEHGIPIISDEIYDKLILEGEVVHTKDVARDVPVISGNGIS
ncbi:MAG: aminotransferase class I/II-fold pyridoxal phosphate-dependent enzyme, partial [Candidatus Micrarchaeota archaeon]